MPEAYNTTDHKKDGHLIIELLCRADGLLRDELREIFTNGHRREFQFLLEAQLNISRAIEAMYDRAADFR